jgi:sulfur-oxidizing protein SoxY
MMSPGRREFLIRSAGLGAAAVLASVLPAGSGEATPAMLDAAIRKIVGEATSQRGRVRLEVPPIVENGNAVPLTIAVDSPMTNADHVAAIHVFNEKNPQPHVVTIHLGPRAGRAQIATRIKLADSQRIVAIAAMSDGSFWAGEAEIIVTIAACVENLP